MTLPIVDAEYCLMPYTQISEAASFVAALSRFLSSPQGSKYLRPLAPAEVWSHVIGDNAEIERIDIYLNANAVDAVRDAFGQLPTEDIWRGDQLPADCVLLIGAGGIEAWGTEEAQWHILSER